jgi:hypothetical protein
LSQLKQDILENKNSSRKVTISMEEAENPKRVGVKKYNIIYETF